MAALFSPFRVLGCITDSVPFASQRLGSETFVVVSVGHSWQIYKCAKLTLSVVGPELPGPISALAAHRETTFAAVGTDIHECTRVHRSGVYKGHKGSVIQLLVLGNLILSLESDSKLAVWRIGDYTEPESRLDLGEAFLPTCMAHPDTYLNKVVIGSKRGTLQLWNFVSEELLYSFEVASCAVRCLTSSPALDVVGIGLSDGRVLLHNLRYDREVASFSNASGVGAKATTLLDANRGKTGGGGACTTISFCTGPGVPLLAAGGGAGAITVWNLEEKRIHTIIRRAHDAALLSLHFFPGEPRLMSSAADNAVKQWLFDAPDGSARLLRLRSGHSAPPTLLCHYGQSNRLLSAGQDRAFRMFSIIQDQQSRELSQGHIAKRARKLKVEEAELQLPRVTAMDACQARERDWANVITAHVGAPGAYTWRLHTLSMGEHVLQPAQQRDQADAAAPVTAVALSSCGNYALVGNAAGRLDRYNMQSGLHRGTYARPALGDALASAHIGSVIGLGPDAANRLLVSAGFDGSLRVWNFKQQTLVREIDVGSRLLKLATRPGTALVATASDDLLLRMYDVETGSNVRTFRGHTDRVTHLTISSDGRWLLSSSMDGTLRVWDIPAARVLQVVVLGAPITSFTLLPGQELLATTHPDKTGIYLWANQLTFRGPADIVPSERPVHAALPTTAGGMGPSELGSTEIEAESDEDPASSEEALPTTLPEIAKPLEGSTLSDGSALEPLLPSLITLSLLPQSRWHTLAHLDAIKERSKPVQPPHKPAAAPFFLPTVAGLNRDPVFQATPARDSTQPGVSLPGWDQTEPDGSGEAAQEAGASGTRKRKRSASEQKGKKSRIMTAATGGDQPSEFLRKLRSGAANSDFGDLMTVLRAMAPDAVDQELQDLKVVHGTSAGRREVDDIGHILHFLRAAVETCCSFEHIQAITRAVLRIHGETIAEHTDLSEQAGTLHDALRLSWKRLGSRLQNVRCLLTFLTDTSA